MKIRTSVTMLPAAFMYQKGKLGMQCPFGIESPNQNFSIGVQEKMTISSCEMDHIVTNISA